MIRFEKSKWFKLGRQRFQMFYDWDGAEITSIIFLGYFRILFRKKGTL